MLKIAGHGIFIRMYCALLVHGCNQCVTKQKICFILVQLLSKFHNNIQKRRKM